MEYSIKLIFNILILILAIFALISNFYYFYIILLNYRLQSKEKQNGASNLQQNQNAKRGRLDTRLYLPQSFLLSFVSIFTIRSIAVLVFDVPSFFLNRSFGGSATAVLFGWLYRCTQCAFWLHLILFTFHKHELFFGREILQKSPPNGLQKKPIFSSRSILQFFTYLLWFPAIIFSLGTKFMVCDVRLSVQTFAYQCGTVVTQWDTSEKSINHHKIIDFLTDDSAALKLKIIDQSIMVFVSLLLFITLIRLLKNFKFIAGLKNSNVAPILVLNSPIQCADFATNGKNGTKRGIKISEGRQHVKQMTSLCCVYFIEVVFLTSSNWAASANNFYLNLVLYVLQIVNSSVYPFVYIWHSKYVIAMRGKQVNI